MLILKQNAANTVPTPPAGKGTIFLDDSDTLSVKTSDGNVETFPTVAASNAQVVFINGTALSGESAFTYDFNNNVLNVTGNIAAGNIKTDNLLYANGTPWDLSDPGGSNTQIQFNDDESFGGSAAFTFDKSSNLVTVGANLNANNLNATTYITSGNVWANSGTISAQTLKGEAGNLSNITAGNITGQVANALVAGTVYTAAQPNITSVGTLTNLAVSGNAIISGNLTVDGNLVYVNVETVAVEDPIIQLQTGPNGATPSSNSGKDVGTALNYYDSQARLAFMGWDVSNAEFAFGSQTTITNEVVTFNTLGNARAQTFKGNIEAAGTSNIAAVNLGGHIIPTADETYDLGNSTNRFRDLWISGNSIRIGNSKIKSNATSLILENPDGGQIVVSGNSTSSTTSIVNGNSNVNIPVANGNVNISAVGAANILVVTGTGVNVAGTLNVTANSNVTNLGASGVLTVTGTATAGNLSTGGTLGVTGNANVGNLGTGGLIVATGNVTGGNLVTGGALSVTGNGNLGNVGATAGVFTGNVTAGNVYANTGTIGASLLTGTLTTAAQGNITSVGILSSLDVTGNVAAGGVKTDNLYYANGSPWDLQLPGGSNTQIQFNDADQFGGSAAFTFNKSSNAVTMTGNLTAGNANLGNLITANIANLIDLNVSGNANIGGGSGGNISGANVISANTFVGNLEGNLLGQVANGNSNVSIPAANGNVNISAVGTANVLIITGTGVNVSGTLNSSGNANVGNLGTAGLITATGNVSGGNLTTAGVVAATGNVSGGNLTTAGAVVATGNVSGGNLTTTGALSVTGNANVGNLGSGGLITATGNVSGGNITTTGQLVSSVATGTAPLVVSSTTKVANLNAELLDGYDTATAATANTVVVRDTNGSFSANIVTATLSGIATNANTVTDAAQPNITSVGTLTSLSVTGNANVGNLGTGGLIVATGNVTGGNLVTSGVLSVTGNANVGNLGTAGLIVATGNVTGGNFTTAGKVIASTIESNVATGTAPFTVASTTKVTNLNADLLDGYSTDTAATANTVVVRDVNGSFSANIVTANLSGNATTAGTVTTAAQPNITSVGTLTSVAVTGNATAGNVYANSGTIGATNLTGTLTTAAQPNITSVGTLSSLSVTGNVAAGNLTTTGVLSVTGTGVSSIAGNLDMTSNNITNLAAPVNSTDAATKQYVDDIAQGLHVHAPSAAATPDTLANISGGTVTYNNGTAGVGATLTTTGTYTTIDTVNIASVGTRILVKNEANAAHNGIYTYTSSTVLTRATDFDTPAEMAGGDFTFVSGGATYNDTGWVMTDPVTTVGTTDVVFVQFSGAGTYTAGTGLTLTGSVFSVNASQTQITSVGTLGSLTVTGNVSGGNLNTAGKVVASTLESNVATGTAPFAVTSTTRVANLNVAYANVADNINVTTQSSGNAYLVFANALTGNVSETANASFVANTSNGALYATTFIGTLSGAATTAGTVTTAAQPNITSVGTLTSLGVNGTVTAVAFTANTGVFTGNGSGLSALAGANVTGTVSSATTAGTVTTAAQPNITSVGTLTSLSSSGNITAPNLIANTGMFISSVNAAVSAAGTVQANATALTTQINVVGTVSSGQGVRLPTAVAGMRVTIMNTSANALAVYPASGGKINSAATDASFSQGAGARLDFVATSATQWYTLNATYA